jgi:cytochrome P450/NADPH-cytochrome P450 reductase
VRLSIFHVLKKLGYMPRLATLDEYAGHLPTTGGVVIVTASYEGHPTDNAKQFVSWLDTLPPNSLTNVKYAVFGCGNRDWFRTYQAVPTRIDEKLAAAGATRMKERGEADAKTDFFGDFDQWYSSLWTSMAQHLGTKAVAEVEEAVYDVEIVKETRSVILRQNDLQPGKIIENREIAGTPRAKRHMEIALPEGVSYRAGDYLVVLPINSKYIIERALKQFGFDHDSHIIIHKPSGKHSSLPTGYSVNVIEILAAYVELSQPATKKQIEKLIEYAQSQSDKEKLQALSYEEVKEKRISVLDLLALCPSCVIPFGLFLEMLPPMRTREYSISSSPLWKEDHCTITLSVLDAPSWSGVAEYKGVASNYLANLSFGRRATVTVHPSATFHLPTSPTVPIIMVGAGTGIAPFRGFIQERALQVNAKEKLTLTFF